MRSAGAYPKVFPKQLNRCCSQGTVPSTATAVHHVLQFRSKQHHGCRMSFIEETVAVLVAVPKKRAEWHARGLHQRKPMQDRGSGTRSYASRYSSLRASARGLTSPIQSSLARLPKATSATDSYVEPPDLLEQDLRYARRTGIMNKGRGLGGSLDMSCRYTS